MAGNAVELGGIDGERAIAFPHHPRCDRIQQLQQQIEAWQALLEKLAGNE